MNTAQNCNPKSTRIDSTVSPGRHEKHCTVCRHAKRLEIEQEWTSWGNTSRIARQYHVSRDSLYRHAHAVGLFRKRERNVRKALERIIEQAETVTVTATAVVAAIQAYAKINPSGQWVERVQEVSVRDRFERMTNQELETYATSGVLPEWFGAAGATASDSEEGGDES